MNEKYGRRMWTEAEVRSMAEERECIAKWLRERTGPVEARELAVRIENGDHWSDRMAGQPVLVCGMPRKDKPSAQCGQAAFRRAEHTRLGPTGSREIVGCCEDCFALQMKSFADLLERRYPKVIA